MFARKLISCKALGPTRYENAQHILVWVYRKRWVRLYLILSPRNHGIRAMNFQRRQLPAHHVLSQLPALRMHRFDWDLTL